MYEYRYILLIMASLMAGYNIANFPYLITIAIVVAIQWEKNEMGKRMEIEKKRMERTKANF